MNILVIGSTGMAGHVIYQYLSERKDVEIANIAYRKPLNASTIIVDVTDKSAIEKAITEINPEVIINCVGILLNGAKNNPANAVYINAYFPHFLSSIAAKKKIRLIHISTDCVFSGRKGGYKDNDIKDAQDIYGMSKALGELINENDLTIRTSIIGPELKQSGEGLLHWFLNQEGMIYGYTEAFWSGITTLQLAKVIEQSIDNNLTGLLQISNGVKISKFDLLRIFKKVWNKNIIINPIPGKEVDKSLIPSQCQFKFLIPSYITMCEELANYMQIHFDQYKHYSKLQHI
jgi:dTDP-4-dehydrorhamnose reductase